jgi:hypothetical protein
MRRAGKKRLDRIDWESRSSRPHKTTRCADGMEEVVLDVRSYLKEQSDLGEYGADAILRELQARGCSDTPSRRTINRILGRRGALDGRRRIRRPPPPRGWYLPEVASKKQEADSFDTIEGLVIRGGPQISVLTGISVHGGLIQVWPEERVTAVSTSRALLEHWRAVGLPGYAQFDNDTRFQGPHQFADTIGRVSRLCMSLGVVPVFAPPRETGFQASVESLNGRWQAKVWARSEHKNLAELKQRSKRYVTAARLRSAERIRAAPARRPFVEGCTPDLTHPQGKIFFLRRTNDTGWAELLGYSWHVDPHWPHRLVRAEVDLAQNRISFFALRRRQPMDQPLLAEADYEIPEKPWRGDL